MACAPAIIELRDSGYAPGCLSDDNGRTQRPLSFPKISLRARADDFSHGSPPFPASVSPSPACGGRCPEVGWGQRSRVVPRCSARPQPPSSGAVRHLLPRAGEGDGLPALQQSGQRLSLIALFGNRYLAPVISLRNTQRVIDGPDWLTACWDCSSACCCSRAWA